MRNGKQQSILYYSTKLVNVCIRLPTFGSPCINCCDRKNPSSLLLCLKSFAFIAKKLLTPLITFTHASLCKNIQIGCKSIPSDEIYTIKKLSSLLSTNSTFTQKKFTKHYKNQNPRYPCLRCQHPFPR